MAVPARERHTLDQVLAWGPLILAAAAGALVVGLAVWAGVLYLQSRGAFMVIDDIVQDRGAVREPWSGWRTEAGSLFRFRLVVNLGGAGVVGAVVALAGLAVWATWSGTLTSLHLVVIGLGGVLVAAVVFAALVADACANEFVAPLMYARRYPVREGFHDLWDFVRDDVGGFAVYVALRLVGAIAVGALVGFLSLLTCGLAMVPFVGTLVLLPALVFLRAFSLDFMSQLSDDLSASLQPVTPPAAAAK